MTEHRTIKVSVYRDNDGHPVCAKHFPSGQVCQFQTTHKFGLVDYCNLERVYLERRPHDGGPVGGPDGAPIESNFLRPPIGGCKVWSNDE